MKEIFGYSYLVDFYGCIPGSGSDINAIYLFLESLPTKIGMQSFSPPLIIKEPATFVPDRCDSNDLIRVPDYPDKAGVSAVIFLITSSIVLHTIEDRQFCTLDVFSCKWFDPKIVKKECYKLFGFTSCDEQFLERGKDYK